MSKDASRAANETRATLLYCAPQNFTLSRLSPVLGTVLAELDLTLRETVSDGHSRLRYSTGAAEIEITACRAPMDRARTDVVGRQGFREGRNTRVLDRLDRHVALLTVTVLPRTDGATEIDGRRREAILHRIGRSVLGLWMADLVLWGADDKLCSIDDFLELGSRGPVIPHRPQAAEPQVLPPGTPPAQPRRPVLINPDDLPDAVPQQGMFNRQRVSPRKVRLGEDGPTVVANDTPELPAPMTETYDRLNAVFRAAKLPDDYSLNADKDASLSARLAVYTVTGTVAVLCFPVGMGLLAYNLIKGEDFTASARVLAMTGVLSGFAQMMNLGALLPSWMPFT